MLSSVLTHLLSNQPQTRPRKGITTRLTLVVAFEGDAGRLFTGDGFTMGPFEDPAAGLEGDVGRVFAGDGFAVDGLDAGVMLEVGSGLLGIEAYDGQFEQNCRIRY